jgi:YD repeat-containing protein
LSIVVGEHVEAVFRGRVLTSGTDTQGNTVTRSYDNSGNIVSQQTYQDANKPAVPSVYIPAVTNPVNNTPVNYNPVNTQYIPVSPTVTPVQTVPVNPVNNVQQPKQQTVTGALQNIQYGDIIGIGASVILLTSIFSLFKRK